jgi:predicted dehydrogenase
MTVNIALVGPGYWGPNLARNLAVTPGARLHTLCDLREARLKEIGNAYPGVKLETDFSRVLEDEEVDAVVIATPVATHFELAKRALLAGKHLLVEKPLATSSADCRTLVALAAERKRTLMVGHVFLYNAAVRQVKAYIDSGELGDVYYVCSQRLNLGIVRQDVNALWNFAPHDVSILNYWFGARPLGVSTRGFSYLQPSVEDVVFMTIDYPGGVGANVHISWLDPRKVRAMTVVGSKKMVVYDDVDTDAPLMIYDKGITRRSTGSAPSEAPAAPNGFGEFRFLTRAGDVVIPRFDQFEPLRAECRHFVECVQTGATPLSDGEEALRVVEVLEAAQESLDRSGDWVELDPATTQSSSAAFKMSPAITSQVRARTRADSSAT